jgi:hypothetical protein
MNKLNNTSKFAIIGVVILAAIILVSFYGGGGPSAPGNSQPSTSTSQSTTGAPSTGGASKSAGNAGGSTGSTVKKPASIIFITPVLGETWKIATPNSIAWSREGGIGGMIELLDAATKKSVGVILNELGPHQTSYAWNTRDLLLSRTNPLKKTVAPGRYLVKISFDGNNLSPITSQPINLEQ